MFFSAVTVAGVNSVPELLFGAFVGVFRCPCTVGRQTLAGILIPATIVGTLGPFSGALLVKYTMALGGVPHLIRAAVLYIFAVTLARIHIEFLLE